MKSILSILSVIVFSVAIIPIGGYLGMLGSWEVAVLICREETINSGCTAIASAIWPFGISIGFMLGTIASLTALTSLCCI
jgi:hypothetical protein